MMADDVFHAAMTARSVFGRCPGLLLVRCLAVAVLSLQGNTRFLYVMQNRRRDEDVDCHWERDSRRQVMQSSFGMRVERNRLQSLAGESILFCQFVSILLSQMCLRHVVATGLLLSTTLGHRRDKELVMQNKSTKISWNPMEAFNFTVANGIPTFIRLT